MAIFIDLSSDTVTLPSPGMQRVMSEAELGGDEQGGTSRTVNQLLQRVADLLGKEAALFFPSGTMCNRVAMKIHSPGGGGILLDATAHVLHAEGGGYAQEKMVAQVIPGDRGIFTLEQLAQTRVQGSQYTPESHLLWIEQTTNLGGGACWPLERIREVCEYAHWNKIPSHLVGARLFNAVVATGVSALSFAAPFDSAWIDFTKGLGAPFGAVLAGSQGFIEEAKRVKQALGGGMRQVGMLAAACLYALDHNVERLRVDHELAAMLGTGLKNLGLDVTPVETNIVIFNVSSFGCSAESIAQELLEKHRIKLFCHRPSLGEFGLRAVTHMDVSRQQIEKTLEAMQCTLARKETRAPTGGALAGGPPGWNAD